MTKKKAAGSAGWAAPMALYLLGIFMGALDTGIITPARPIVASDLGVDDASGIWMITIYTLAYAASIPIMGKLADRQGRKRVYLFSIALFGIGSLLCGLSQDVGSFPMLIAARALQAVGGGGILPIATAEIGTEVPAEKRGMALGFVGMVYGVANIFGASAGSLILDIVGSSNWQWIFYINVPIAIGIIIAGWMILPDHRESEVKPIDVLGTLLVVVIILSLLYGIKNLDFFDIATSIQSLDVWPFLLGCLVALPLFVLAERRAADPVINLHYFTNRGIGLTLLLSMLSGVVLMAVVFVPQLAENALGIPSGKGGYFVIVLGLASGVGAPISGRLTDRFGAKAVLAFGMASSAVAAAAVVLWMIPHPSLPSVIVSLALIGLGLGFVVGSPLNYMMLERTPKKESSSALGTLSLVRSLGTTIAPAIMVGFIANGAAGLQDSLTAQLPDKVTVPTLPHAAELTTRINTWKTDENLKDKLAGVDIPDLTQTEVAVNTDGDGGGTLPDDLQELLRTADVTTITERTKVVATYMFSENTPQTIADIQKGVDSGVQGLTTGLTEADKGRKELSDQVATMDTKLADMGTGLKEMDSKIAEMDSGLAGMDDGITEMKAGIAKMDASLDEMASGVAGMDSGLAGLDKAIAGMKQPIAGLDSAIAGMDAGLTQQKAALAKLEKVPDPSLAPQIKALKASIAQLQGERDAAASKRSGLATKLAATQAERTKLAADRTKLADGREALRKQRITLSSSRDELIGKRAALAKGRTALSTERGKLADGRKALTDARAELAKALTELDASRAELKLSIDQLGELKAAVPGAFDQALASYLAEIDNRSPQLKATFAAGLGEGFRGVYLFDLVVCLLSLGIIALVPGPLKESDSEAEAGAEPATV